MPLQFDEQCHVIRRNYNGILFITQIDNLYYLHLGLMYYYKMKRLNNCATL